MKKVVIWLMCCLLVAVALGATIDERNDGMRPIGKLQFTQLDWATGEGHAAQTTSINNANMLIERIDVLVSSVTANPTVAVTITDENSCTIATLTGLTDGTNHVKLATKATADFDAIPVNNTLTISVDPSADAGGVTQTLTVDVILYGP